MADPFLIEGPAIISFSGGRTSGYMLRRILDAGLQTDVHIIFADTGKERKETLAFVADCAKNWGVEIHTVVRSAPEGVTPFEQLITDRKFCPGPRMRFCTTEMKVRPMKKWMLARGYKHWTNVVGLRADEPRRVANQRAKEGRERWDLAFPLYDAGITEADVLAYWKTSPFDLQLKSYEGNCDLCHLKSEAKLLRIIRENPGMADWWIEQEKRTGTPFRPGRRSYAQLVELAKTQTELFDDGSEPACACTD